MARPTKKRPHTRQGNPNPEPRAVKGVRGFVSSVERPEGVKSVVQLFLDKPLRWSARIDEIAQMVADGKTTDTISKLMAYSTGRINTLRRHPDFKQRVADINKRTQELLESRGILARENRLRVLNEFADGLLDIWQQRKADTTMHDVPGGDTGLMIRKVRIIKVIDDDADGPHQEIIYEYEIDQGLIDQYKALSKQAAQELGEWSEKRELSGANGGPIQMSVLDLIAFAAQQDAIEGEFQDVTDRKQLI